MPQQPTPGSSTEGPSVPRSEGALRARSAAASTRGLDARFASGASILIDSGDGETILELDEETAQRFGWKREALVGQSIRKLFPPEWQSPTAALLARCRRGETIQDAEGVRWTQSGRRAPTLLSFAPSGKAQGDHESIAVSIRDVAELGAREALLRQLEASLPVVLWVQALAEQRIVYVSGSYEAIWGRPLADIGERSTDWLEAVTAADRPRVEAAFERLLARGQAFDEQYRIDRPDGQQRWIRDQGVLVIPGSGEPTHLVGAALDVTEQVALQERLQGAIQAVERVEEAERKSLASDLHDSVGQLLPLAAIKLDALLDSEPGASAGFAESVSQIRSLLAEAEHQVRTLTFQLSPVSDRGLGFTDAAERTVELLRQQYGLSIDLEIEGAVGPVDDGYSRVLLRGLRELLINVARHAETEFARVRIERPRDLLLVSVEDGGMGFATSGDEPAEGFGLVMLRDRLERLGGALEIESRPEKGSVVRMRLPLPAGSGWRKTALVGT